MQFEDFHMLPYHEDKDWSDHYLRQIGSAGGYMVEWWLEYCVRKAMGLHIRAMYCKYCVDDL